MNLNGRNKRSQPLPRIATCLTVCAMKLAAGAQAAYNVTI